MKVGDKVEIISDDMVVRVGYPYGFAEAKTKLEDDYLEDFKNLLVKQYPFLKNARNLDKIHGEFVFAYNDQHLKYGGSVRSIHTTKRPDLNGQFAIITEVNRRITGDRMPGGSYEDPPYLYNQKCNMIYTVQVIDYTKQRLNLNWEPVGHTLMDEENIKYEKSSLKLIERAPA